MTRGAGEVIRRQNHYVNSLKILCPGRDWGNQAGAILEAALGRASNFTTRHYEQGLESPCVPHQRLPNGRNALLSHSSFDEPVKPARDVETYIANAPEEARLKLKEIRNAIRDAAPDSIESISYGMPFYSFKGETGFHARLCYFGFLKEKIVFYTRPTFLEEHMDEAEMYLSTKSSLHFPLDRPIPIRLIKKLLRNGIRKHEAGKD